MHTEGDLSPPLCYSLGATGASQWQIALGPQQLGKTPVQRWRRAATQMSPVPVWAPESRHPHPHPHLVPSLTSGQPGCHVHAARKEGGSPEGGCFSQHHMSWKDKCKNIKSLWSWGPLHRSRGWMACHPGDQVFTVRSLRSWLHPGWRENCAW